MLGHKNVKHHSLVESSRILLPPLHIKLGLMKNFVKAMDCNGTAFLYLWQEFPLLSDAKIWEGVFTSPDIRSLLCDEVLECIIAGDEQRAWRAFQEVVTGFLRNRRADNYKDLVEELLSSYQKLGCICPWKSTFWVLIWTSFRRTVVLWVTSTVNVSTQTMQQWRADTKGNGAHLCLLIIAGPWCMIVQIRRSNGRRRRPDCTRVICNLQLMTQYR